MIRGRPRGNPSAASTAAASAIGVAATTVSATPVARTGATATETADAPAPAPTQMAATTTAPTPATMSPAAPAHPAEASDARQRASPTTVWTTAGVAALLGAALTLVALGLDSTGGVPPTRSSAAGIAPGDLVRMTIALAAGAGASAIDLRERRIPNLISLPAAAALCASSAAESAWRVARRVAEAGAFAAADLVPLALTALGGAVAGGVLFAFAWFGTLGLGDVKLAMVLGAALLPAFGWSALLVAFIAAYVLALPHALVALTLRRRLGPDAHELPFGPYLVGGAVVAVILAVTLGPES